MEIDWRYRVLMVICT